MVSFFLALLMDDLEDSLQGDANPQQISPSISATTVIRAALRVMRLGRIKRMHRPKDTSNPRLIHDLE